MKEEEILNFKEGQSHKAELNGMRDARKIHIMYVLDGYYTYPDNKPQKLIVFRYYGKHKQWWHQEMLTDQELSFRIWLHEQRG